MKNIYNMNLHESIKLNNDFNFYIIRVPGGWIYYKSSSIGYTTIFVPYNREFLEEIKQKGE